MAVIRQIYVNELDGMEINAGDPMPYPIPLWTGVGKNPMVQTLKVNIDGTKDFLPLVYPSFEYNSEGFVKRIWIHAEANGPIAVDNMVVNIYPQQYLNV